MKRISLHNVCIVGGPIACNYWSERLSLCCTESGRTKSIVLRRQQVHALSRIIIVAIVNNYYYYYY